MHKLKNGFELRTSHTVFTDRMNIIHKIPRDDIYCAWIDAIESGAMKTLTETIMKDYVYDGIHINMIDVYVRNGREKHIPDEEDGEVYISIEGKIEDGFITRQRDADDMDIEEYTFDFDFTDMYIGNIWDIIFLWSEDMLIETIKEIFSDKVDYEKEINMAYHMNSQ